MKQIQGIILFVFWIFATLILGQDIGLNCSVVNISGTKPSPRAFGAGLIVNDQFHIFGGIDANNQRVAASDSAWRFNITSQKWIQLPTPPNTILDQPCATYDPNSQRVLIYPASALLGLLSVVMAYNPVTQTYASVISGLLPAAGSTMSVGNVGGTVQLFIFGGRQTLGLLPLFLVFDITNLLGILTLNLAGLLGQPSPRLGHSSTFLGNFQSLLIVGGQDASGNLLNDMSLFDANSKVWKTLTPHVNIGGNVLGIGGHVMAFTGIQSIQNQFPAFSNTSAVLTFGGKDGSLGSRGDFWATGPSGTLLSTPYGVNKLQSGCQVLRQGPYMGVDSQSRLWTFGGRTEFFPSVFQFSALNSVDFHYQNGTFNDLYVNQIFTEFPRKFDFGMVGIELVSGTLSKTAGFPEILAGTGKFNVLPSSPGNPIEFHMIFHIEGIDSLDFTNGSLLIRTNMTATGSWNAFLQLKNNSFAFLKSFSNVFGVLRLETDVPVTEIIDFSRSAPVIRVKMVGGVTGAREGTSYEGSGSSSTVCENSSDCKEVTLGSTGDSGLSPIPDPASVALQKAAGVTTIAIAAGSAAGGLLLISMVVLVIVWRKRLSRRDTESARMSKKQLTERTLGFVSEISDCEIFFKIGEGNFGEVFKAKIHNGATLAAAKRLKAGRLDVSWSSILSEITICASLRHPNIVLFYGIYSSKSDRYIVSEYIEGGSLDSWLASKQSVSDQQMLQIVLETARGMGCLAANDIIHCDLAARNILMTSKGNVKISDFGVSKLYGKKQEKNENDQQVAVAHAAPEVLSKGKFSEYSDVWSFGVVMYEVYTKGQVPYRNLSHSDIFKSVTETGNSLLLPPSAPDVIASVMNWCFTFSPEKRPSFSALVKRLENFCQEQFPDGNFEENSTEAENAGLMKYSKSGQEVGYLHDPSPGVSPQHSAYSKSPSVQRRENLYWNDPGNSAAASGMNKSASVKQNEYVYHEPSWIPEKNGGKKENEYVYHEP